MEYHHSGLMCTVIKIDHDEKQQSCVELFNMLKSIDEKFSKLDTLPALENGGNMSRQ